MNVNIIKDINIIENEIKKYKEILEIILINPHELKENKTSDYIDICIILDYTNIQKRKLMKSLRKEVFNKIDASINILIYYKKDFFERAKLISTLEYNIRKTGSVIYTK